jgi:hypothetical protein
VTRYRAQVAEVLRAIVIRSGHRFSWLGDTSDALPTRLATALPAEIVRADLVRGLAKRLYESFYCEGRVVPVHAPGADTARPDPAVVVALFAANAGRGTWERGWRLDAVEGGALVVARDGLRVWAPESECRIGGGALRLGAPVAVRLPSALPAISPGFFTVVGNADLAPGRGDLIARLYFNVSCAAGPALVARLTRMLNGACVRFRLKVVDHPDRFTRCDAAVVYLHAGDLRARRRLLSATVRAGSVELEPGTPAFTKRLADGVGIAEERVGGNDSFGMRRCRVVADAAIAAHELGIRDLPGRSRLVERHFADAGIDIDAPYLESGSEDVYAL